MEMSCKLFYLRELTKKFEGDPIDMYEALRDMNPSPYMYFWIWMDFK